ncbi:MAG TPA: sulfite exporter TauE/SafE family protein, partial [Acidimicrobiia bacterium]|nr:sulfite exporter TauE/SafE family protein [Acidimicrobiia bacterium]
LLLLLAGIAAGFVNTVAGGGSVITLPVLVEIVGASVANGTNRVAILMENAVAAVSFHGGKKVPWRFVAPLLLPIIVGAGAGAWVATLLSAETMRRVFGVVIVLVALSMLIRPSRWMQEGEPRIREPWRSLAFLGIGFYGGFVQAGVGFLLLVGLVLVEGLGLIRGNAAKVVLILAYTPLSLFLFARAGQVDWAAGATLGVGSMTGALIASRLAIRKGAAGWIRWVVIAAALMAALRMLLT